MKIQKAYRFRLEPTFDQQAFFANAFGCARFVWNKALALQMGRLEGKIPLLSYGDLAKLLTLWRSSDEYGFLAECPVHTQQWSLKFLNQAIWEGLDKTNPKKFPAFRKKGIHETLRFPDSKQIHFCNKVKDQDGRTTLPRVFLPKVGWVKMRKSREIDGTVKNATVTKKGNHWYISIQTEKEIEARKHPSNSAVGIDLGIVRFATLSNKEVIEPLCMKAQEKQLAWEQRKLSRKKKFSKNWIAQKKQVQKVYKKIANIRLNFLHKHSTNISKNHAIVFMENLKVSNMSASAKGTVEEPGTNVKAKSGLNRAILRQGWYMFRQMVNYKLCWQGGTLLLVPPQYTSQECPDCYHIDKENRKKQQEFKCVKCNYQEHADLVGSLNVLRAGRAQFACC